MASKNQLKVLFVNAKSIIEQLQEFDVLLKRLAEVASENDLKLLKIEFEHLRPLLDEYKTTTNQIIAAKADLDELPSLSQFRNWYFELTLAAENWLGNRSKSRSVSRSSSNESINSRASVTRSGATKDNVKLPTIALPSFDGNHQNFRSFFETFQALVGSNVSLSQTEKFLYLKNCLKGSASHMVSELKSTESNYDVAISLLKERYDNRKLLIFSHFEGFLEAPKLSRDSNLRDFYDNLIKHLRAVENENVTDVEYKNAVIAYVVKNKTDSRTAAEFAKDFPKRIPSIQEISKFLSDKCNVLDDTNNLTKFSAHKKPDSKGSYTLAQTSNFCSLCNEQHFLNHCPSFLSLSTKARFHKARSLKICLVCLRHGNNAKCTSTSNCKTCNKRHNSLLCFKGAMPSDQSEARSRSNAGVPSSPPAVSDEGSSTAATTSADTSLCNLARPAEVLLATAQVRMISGNKSFEVRALLDPGSQHNLISERLHKRLDSPHKSINLILKGVNDAVSSCSKYTSVELQSTTGRFKANIDCLVVPTITEQLPRVRFNKDRLDIPPHLRLADSSFNERGDVDILLGSSMFYKVLLPQRVSLGTSLPTLQGTLLGWVVAGDLPSDVFSFANLSTCCLSAVSCHTTTQVSASDHDLHATLSKFWELDNPVPISDRALLSDEERFCEDHFAKTTYINDSGHITVSIPFNSKLTLLGDSRQIAESRFIKLEKRLQRSPELLSEYAQFIDQYRAMGHMTKISDSESHNPSEPCFVETIHGPVDIADIPPQFFPHHAVVKQSSLTTKLRVVFDASVLTSTGISVNDTQIVGPQVQENLFNILLRFRIHPIALCGDIAKMYRMIDIIPSSRKLQHILWRDRPDEPLDVYRLNTITYGTAAASYLATRCLLFLAELYKDSLPEASRVISKHFYMDDLLFSTDSVDEALQIKKDVSSILASAGLTIRKFLSNAPEVLGSANPESIELATLPMEGRSDSKTLGLHWDSLNDLLFCKLDLDDDTSVPTKRKMLSIIARIYDPLGFISPIVIRGKLFIQKLWQLGLNWDDPVPEDLIPHWSSFRSQLLMLNDIRIPRWIASPDSHTLTPPQTVQPDIHWQAHSRAELHGFCDSSSTAFGCCFYVRYVFSDGSVRTNLLFSKSRVAPLRTISIPRLELCAAVLMAQWCFETVNSFDIKFHDVVLWTDSKIVLSWINATPNKYKVFVANRIATIQECTNTQDWHHVATSDNPADLISRGTNIADLKYNRLWFHGPDFLSQNEAHWNIDFNIIDLNELTEAKNTTLVNAVSARPDDFTFERVSSLGKLQRVVAYALRFIHNCRKRDKLSGPLDISELKVSLTTLTKLCQRESFSKEIEAIKNNEPIKSSRIQALDPFLDSQGCLRVGGRLTNSNFQFEKKHPALLPKNHKLTEQVVRHFHKELLHGGAQQLLYNIREQFWPIGGLSCIKKIIKNCVPCFRVKPIVKHPIMGNLPETRLNLVCPFYNVGLDYAGPIMIKDRNTRGARLSKCYICVFVCMVTRAIHLELVTSLTTEAFINALKRFIARRGVPRCISSDNATNFRGAKSKIDNLYALIRQDDSQLEIISYLTQRSIKWEFINPRSPHEGGLWEGAVKSVKFHMRRILENANLTFEHLYTTLTMIESILNSRPLSRISSDPNDLTPLSPGHFLIGRPLVSIPEPDLTVMRENRLNVFQRSQKMAQHFWKRWSREVVSDLQRRQKWTQRLPDLLRPDTVVLVQEDAMPPQQWCLGRVVQLHRGHDEVLRAASIRLSTGRIVRRSVHRLCVLPV